MGTLSQSRSLSQSLSHSLGLHRRLLGSATNRLSNFFTMLLFVMNLIMIPAWTIARPHGPCDIYAAAHNPCVAAHSMVRALYAAYDGPLYLIKRTSDQATMLISVDPSTGFAAAGKQKIFCPSSTKCEVIRIFDQSPQGNHLDK